MRRTRSCLVWLMLTGIISLTGRSLAFDVAAVVTPLQSSSCSGGFIAHDLAHITKVDAQPIRMFDSNGSGLAINDLNGDGMLDIVLANLDGENTILWNGNNLQFRRETLDVPGRARGVSIVDVDGDGRLDIVLTTQVTAPIFWRNIDGVRFERVPLRGVTHYAYTLDWADVDTDGDLDLVTGSYDSELEQVLNNSFMFGTGAGVIYYENRRDYFQPTRLAEESQALALLMTDFDSDGSIEIAVGNDFAVPDQFWEWQATNWIETRPFQQLTYSTMSFDVGDIDNKGLQEFFAADMKPYAGGNMQAWRPVLQRLQRFRPLPGDLQIIENVLQTHENGTYTNIARRSGIDATGWSWSAKFGDLDSDGWLDLYVVNGMIAAELFGNLPNNELVEENQALRNMGDLVFQPRPDWGLDSTRSGRGMSMADLDGDGDLDIVINNLGSAAQLFENQICGGDNLIVRLRRPDTLNRYAIGARVSLRTGAGVLTRDLRTASGYLSGDPSELHFGFPSDTTLHALEVEWGDGTTSQIDSLTPNTILTITRSF